MADSLKIKRDEITKVMEYFSNHNYDSTDRVAVENLKRSIAKIFQTEVQEMGYVYDYDNPSRNTITLTFTEDVSSSKRGFYRHGVRSLPLVNYNLGPFSKRLSSDDKESRLECCKDMFKTVFHEIQHGRQHLIVANKYGGHRAILYARDFILQNYMEHVWYTRDKNAGNYEYYFIEDDANEVGYAHYLEAAGEQDNARVVDNHNILTGKSYIDRYKANISSKGSNDFYYSYGFQERDDVTIPIIDDAICNKGFRHFLKNYPIMQREYNLDGRKKDIVELATDMEKTLTSIGKVPSISASDKNRMIEDIKKSYYELILNQMMKCSDYEVSLFGTKLGKNKTFQLLSDMEQYFHSQLEYKLGMAVKMNYSNINRGQEYLQMEKNEGVISINKNGANCYVDCSEFIKTIDPVLLEKKITNPKTNEEITAEKFIEKYFFPYLPANGVVKLIDGRTITAKEYIEKYALQTDKYSESYSPRNLMRDTLLRQTVWDEYGDTRSRLVEYYASKKNTLSEFSQRVKRVKKGQSILDQEKSYYKNKSYMQWVRNFMSDYDFTEESASFAMRSNCEEENVSKVIESIKNGSFDKKFDNNASYDSTNSIQVSKTISSIARLLKAADNISIEGGTDYLSLFANLPEVRQLLVELNSSSEYMGVQDKASKNRLTRSNIKFPKTDMEKDKDNVIKYFRGGNFKCGDSRSISIENEISYWKDRINGNNGRGILAPKDINSETSTIQQRVSLVRILTRQSGTIAMKNNRERFVGSGSNTSPYGINDMIADYYSTESKPLEQHK